MIALFFKLLSSNRRRVERILYALLWPLFSVIVYCVLCRSLGAEGAGRGGLPLKEAIFDNLLVFGYLAPASFVTSTIPHTPIALLITLVATERFAIAVRREKIREHRGEEFPDDSGARN